MQRIFSPCSQFTMLSKFELNWSPCELFSYTDRFLYVLIFSSSMQNSSFEIVCSRQTTLLERKGFWNKQPGLFFSQRYNGSLQYSDQACRISLHVLFLQQPEVFLCRELRDTTLPSVLCHWYSLRFGHLPWTWSKSACKYKYFNFKLNHGFSVLISHVLFPLTCAFCFP